MRQSALLRLLQVPLAWKIAGANALLVLALGAGFFMIPGARGGAATYGIVAAEVVLALAMNILLVTVALRPIRELERTAAAVWSGELKVRANPTRLADRELNRVARTINTLLERLEVDRRRLREINGQLVEARSSERAALARELTETAAQSATALALECAALEANGEPSGDRVGRVRKAASGLADDLRRIARDLHPRHIGELGLDTALRSLVRETCSDRLSDCTFESHGRTATAAVLGPVVANALYDAAREALQNTKQHSGARRVSVSLGVELHAARLSVIDDGCGFNPESLSSAPPGGLDVVRERMALLGGTLEILSHPGKGTHIVAIVPLARPAQAAAPPFPQPEGV